MPRDMAAARRVERIGDATLYLGDCLDCRPGGGARAGDIAVTAVNQYRRLRCENVECRISAGEDVNGQPLGHHEFTICLAYDDDGVLREVNFVGRGKIGHAIDLMFHDLGIALSRAIQGRNPTTGQPWKLRGITLGGEPYPLREATEAELAEQRKSWVRGEMAFGLDREEAADRAAGGVGDV